MNFSLLKYHKLSVLLLLAGIVFYWLFAYELVREDFVELIIIYTALFAVSLKLIQLEKNNFWFLAGAALLFRLIFITALPNLSQDFYRFIWDGQLFAEGLNPYLFTPNEWQSAEITLAQKDVLIAEMGALSAGNYTSYPPVNQLIFAVSTLLGGTSIVGPAIIMRVLIIAADFGTLYLGKRLLEKLKLPVHRIFWYILNPFIIIELTGNLHFEGVMIFFLIWSLYLLHKNQWMWSAVLLGISVSVKLLPLLFLPLFYRFLTKKKDPSEFQRSENSIDDPEQEKKGIRKLISYYAIVGGVFLVSFLPFLSSEVVTNFIQSISLWFQKFEFNASLYYIIRWIGFRFTGYNVIATAGKILPGVVVLILAGLAFFRKNDSTVRLISTMLLGVSAYFFLSTTVHPWYIATPLALSIFTRYRFVLWWSFLVFLSYSAYSGFRFEENLWLVALEYVVVMGIFIAELLRGKELRVPEKENLQRS